MDFDLSKENIQPLRGGRNAAQLEAGLQAQHNPQIQQELIQQKQHFEHVIATYSGDDPLENHYQYIFWVEQTFPKHGHEGDLMNLIEKCLHTFENDPRYHNDQRFCKLWIKYIDMQPNQTEFYQLLYSKRICIGFADMYKAWSYYHEAAGDYKRANQVYKLGKQELAQPYQELDDAHNNFIFHTGFQMLNNGADTQRLADQRQALTKLQTYKPGQVGSIRVASTSGAGVLPLLGHENRAALQVAPLAILEDYQDILIGAGAPPDSVISVAKREARKENFMKAGIWTGGMKKVHTVHKTSNIQISEDFFVPHVLGIQLSPNAVSATKEDFSDWVVPISLPEPDDPNKIPMYCKQQCYADPSVEYSMEEVRARHYMPKKMSIGSTMDMDVPQRSASSSSLAMSNSMDCMDTVPDTSSMTSASLHMQHISHVNVTAPVATPVPHHSVYPYESPPKTQLTPMENARPSTSTMHVVPHMSQYNLHGTSAHHQHSYVTHSPYRMSPHAYEQPAMHHQQMLQQQQQQHQQPWQLRIEPHSMVENSQYNEPKTYTNLTMHSPQVHPQEAHAHTEYSTPMHSLADTSMPSTLHPQTLLQFNETASPAVDVNFLFDDEPKAPMAQPALPHFAIYEPPSMTLYEPQHHEPKGNAMKTPIKALNDDELAETGSRGGLDTAAAAQPTDGAKRLPHYEDEDSFTGFGEPYDTDLNSTNTQLFSLHAMHVSTPQNKQMAQPALTPIENKSTKKRLFLDQGNMLSAIVEEGSSAGSSGSYHQTMHKSAFGISKPQMQMEPVAENSPYQFNFSQNMKANAELRLKLGMDCDSGPNSPGSTPVTYAGDDFPEALHHVPYPVLNIQPTDPFTNKLLDMFLHHVGFPGRHRRHFMPFTGVPKLCLKKDPCYVANHGYLVERVLGKGSYGSVYKAMRCDTGAVVALKFQKPANRWEFYICREIQMRLADHALRHNFMDVHLGYFSDAASVLVSDVHFGSMLDLVNAIKANLKHAQKHHLSIFLTIEMLRIVQVLHQIQIIHADIKPDNFLIMLRNETVQLQLIDFGCAIDMSLMPGGTSFTRKVKTDSFQCCEMKDDRPWNYHTDLFCIAATTHLILWESYMELKKTEGRWHITKKIPRYHREDLWSLFFNSLLNMQDGLADIGYLVTILEDALDPKELRPAITYVTNLLRSR